MKYTKTNQNSIKSLFNDIAINYDKLNCLISFGMQKTVKYLAVKNAIRFLDNKPIKILDLCTGTGDIAVLFEKICPNAEIVAVDFSEQMLSIAKKRSPNITFVQKDILCLGEEKPFEKASFDLCFISFGLRNLPNIDAFFEYVSFYLKDDGAISVLDLGKPNKFFSCYFEFHYNFVIPFIAKLFAKNVFAYKYLIESAKTYPSQEEILEKLLAHKFLTPQNINYFCGIISQQLAKYNSF